MRLNDSDFFLSSVEIAVYFPVSTVIVSLGRLLCFGALCRQESK